MGRPFVETGGFSEGLPKAEFEQINPRTAKRADMLMFLARFRVPKPNRDVYEEFAQSPTAEDVLFKWFLQEDLVVSAELGSYESAVQVLLRSLELGVHPDFRLFLVRSPYTPREVLEALCVKSDDDPTRSSIIAFERLQKMSE